MIDYIYYIATTTDQVGSSTVITGQYFVPFLDFLLVFLVFSFSVLITWFTFYLLYPRKKEFIYKKK